MLAVYAKVIFLIYSVLISHLIYTTFSACDVVDQVTGKASGMCKFCRNSFRENFC